MVELVILDIDGVMTDGRKYYDATGMPVLKTYCDKDFTAIKRLRASGVKVCFLSGDEFVNKAMAKNRNIDFYAARGQDKADFIEEFSVKYDTHADNMAYIGDDLFDMSIMKVVGHPYCPNDACTDIKEVCGVKNTLQNNGGCNVVAELVDILLKRNMISDASMKQIEELDKREKF